MAATAGVAIPIKIWKVLGTAAANPTMKRYLEKASQTFYIGTPLQLDSGTGYLQACPTINSAATAVIAGFATEFGNNLTTSGVAKSLTYGTVQNQANAVLIPVGAPPNDGTMGVEEASDDNVFVGLLGNSATDANATTAQTDEGAIYGLTKDATTGFWYIDNNITTVAAGACVQIVSVIDAVGTLHGREAFKILRSAQQLFK